MTDYLVTLLISIPAYVIFFTFRGYAQAWTAKKLGDDTPERDGFLTMNPAAHINPIGFICLLLLHFGFGKPMRFNSRNYRHVKRDGAIQILSAPISGVILACIGYLIYVCLFVVGVHTSLLNQTYWQVLMDIFYAVFSVSLSLTVFLFLPLPGFDCYRLIANFLPYRYYRKLYTIEKYSMFIFIGFIILLNVPVIGTFLWHILISVPAGLIGSAIQIPLTALANLLV